MAPRKLHKQVAQDAMPNLSLNHTYGHVGLPPEKSEKKASMGLASTVKLDSKKCLCLLFDLSVPWHMDAFPRHHASPFEKLITILHEPSYSCSYRICAA